MQRYFASGGGVAPETARLRGQSTIENVLIAAVIGLVVVFAAPQVAGAIRNQFNRVTETLDEGTTENTFKDAVDVPDPKRGTAFAVYSEDDHSLMFYKRRGVPKVGDMFNSRRVTEVYTGFETDTYKCVKGGSNGYEYEADAVVDTPWYGERLKIASVDVVDSGISPSSVDYWFMNFNNCIALRLNRLDTSRCNSLLRTFNRCKSATDIEVSSWNVTNVSTMLETFLDCNSLKTLNLSSWDTANNRCLHSTWNNCWSLSSIVFGSGWNTSQVTDFSCAFYSCIRLASISADVFDTQNAIEMRCMLNSCTALKADCSKWDVTKVIDHLGFAEDSPGVTAPRWAE